MEKSKEYQLIAQNNILREQLNPENAKYYGDFLVYMRFRNFNRDDEALEQQLLNILQDIIDAQKDGISAKAFFGKEPKVIANEILATIPRNYKGLLKWIWLPILMFVGFSTLSSLITGEVIDLGALIVSGIYITILVILGMWLLAPMIYAVDKQTDKFFKWVQVSVIGLAILVVVTSLVLIGKFLKTPLRFTLAGWPGLIVIVTVLIGSIVGFTQLKRDDKQVWFSFLFSFGEQVS